MGDQIEFPKNYGTYMHHAMSALQSGNYEKAIELLKKAYAIKEENSLNVLLVSALFHNGQVEEAMDLAENKQTFYTTNDKRVLLYVELLIHNHQFLLAQKFIDERTKDPSGIYADNWKTLQETLLSLKEELEKKRKALEEERIKKLFSLASALPEEQFAIIQDAHLMRTENLVKAAPSVFQNPYVHPIARSGFLSLLISRKVDQKYTYSWFGQTKDIHPVHMTAFEDTYMVQKLLDETEELFIQNPSLIESVKNELNMILLLLYPFIEDVIKEEGLKIWIQTIAEMVDPSLERNDESTDKQAEFIHSWISRIHQEFQ